jgi:hypothetical protein
VIGTKIDNPLKSAPVKVRVVKLTTYMAQPETENKEEKCIHYEARNFIASTPAGQRAEMIALAEEATRSTDPIDHWVLSWPKDEKPTIEEAREAIEIFLTSVGMVDHQCMWALHDDTKDRHLHIALNRVDPVTHRVTKINKGFDKIACQRAVTLIEHAQGWRPEANALFHMVDGKPVLKVPETERVKSDEPSQRSIKMERQTGQKSPERIGKEIAKPIIRRATTWAEVHAGLAAVGMEYKRDGSGARVWIGGVGVKASAVDRAASFGTLQERLGPFKPAKELEAHDYHHHTPEPYPTGVELSPANAMRRLSECRLARAPAGDKEAAPRAGVLQIDALSDRRLSDELRRQAGSETRTATEPDTGPDTRPDAGPLADEALHRDQPGWHEYRALRSERDTAQRAAMRALDAQQARERAQLVAEQKRERALELAGSWRGRGAQRNALEAVLAAKHKDARARLAAMHKGQRQAARARRPALPTYRQWCAAPMIVITLTHLPYTVEDLDPRAKAKRAQCARFLASLTQSIDARGRTTYQRNGRVLFRDAGRQIDVFDTNNPQAIAAALAVAREKFGPMLTLTGPHDFQIKAVEAAVANGIDCRFADVRLEQMRAQLVADRLQRLAEESRPAPAVPAAPLPPPAPLPQALPAPRDDEDDEDRDSEGAPGMQ